MARNSFSWHVARINIFNLIPDLGRVHPYVIHMSRTVNNAPDAEAGQQDFIKGWPNADLLTHPELVSGLKDSYLDGMEHIGSALNYGTAAEGAHVLGHPVFLSALSEFLGKQYGKPAPAENLMSTIGASLGTDMIARVHCKVGDIAVSEAPTYYLAHQVKRQGS